MPEAGRLEHASGEEAGRSLPPAEEFSSPGWHGQLNPRYRPTDLEATVQRMMDPGSAEETIHWGRNYLYRTNLETPGEKVPVVVKQFRNQGFRARHRRWRGGSKGLRSWRVARGFEAAGLGTAEPVMLIESEASDGPSFFVTRHLEGVVEARFLLRAANRSREQEEFPGVDFPTFLDACGRALRRMHDSGFFHRDLSIGNVLLRLDRGGRRAVLPEDLYIIDLNRTRWLVGGVGTFDRTRDLCRLSLFRQKDRSRFLAAYWDQELTPFRRFLYELYRRGFLFKIESKKWVRAKTSRLRDWLRPRRAHAHIPSADPEAKAREKIVWDHLSDQPHQHASKMEKLGVRLLDAPSHLRQNAAFLGAAPRIWSRYKELMAGLYQEPVPFDGMGICVRPEPENPGELLAALDDLGVENVLLRLHPWEDDHTQEEELAKELVHRGYDLTFALPQNRDLVRDPARWRAKIEELAEIFVPFGTSFQVGQAVNRSKWGIWRFSEYFELATAAAEILRRHPGVQVLGPAVIDFELQATAALLNLDVDLHFDAVASLLYVDRRGAPENTQLGFDSVGKIVLLKAIAETARNSGPGSWITEVNWPLWEGPHSPAGKSVSVDESTQASYLTRFFLLGLATGAVERIYWWQLVARGYGLMTRLEGSGGLRRRPAFSAMATLAREVGGSRFLRPLVAPEGACLYLFEKENGDRIVAGWCKENELKVKLPGSVSAIVERDGEVKAADFTPEVKVGPAVRFFRF